MRTMRRSSGSLTGLCVVGLASMLWGGLHPAAAAPPQTFFGPTQNVGSGTARSYVTMADGAPISIGMEFTKEALEFLPPVLPDVVVPVYIAPLPAETAGTPFKFVLVAYVASHEVPNTGGPEPAHFHVVFMINPPVQGATPPFANETASVAPAEVPQGTRPVIQPSGQPVIVPGVGVNYDDPTVPAFFPELTTLGQNFFFYNGHMNGIALGPTIDFMKTKKSYAGYINQPQIYPQAGAYPLVEFARYDATRNVYLVGMVDFQPAAQVVP